MNSSYLTGPPENIGADKEEMWTNPIQKALVCRTVQSALHSQVTGHSASCDSDSHSVNVL